MLEYFPLPEDQQWRAPLILELLDVLSKKLYIDDFTPEQLTTMIDFICSS